MASYDENLLRSAPVATKAQIQDGYDPALLEGKHTPSGSTTHLPPDLEPGRATPNRSPIQQSPGPAPFASEKPLPPDRKQPFYRTTKGIIIIVVALLVIIAAVVGGAVGGTQKKNQVPPALPSQGQSISGGSDSQGTSNGTSTDPASVNPSISQQTVGPASTPVQDQNTQSTSTSAIGGPPAAGITTGGHSHATLTSETAPGQATAPAPPPDSQGASGTNVGAQDGSQLANPNPQFGTNNGGLGSLF